MKVTIRKKALTKKKNQVNTHTLYLDIYDKGTRTYEFLNMYISKDKHSNKETMLLVNKIRTDREAELRNNVHGFIPDYKRRASFIQYYETKFVAGMRIDSRHSMLNYLKKYTKGKLSFNQINEKWLEDFKKYLLSTKISQNSASLYFQHIKQALNDAKTEKIIITNPGEYIKNIPKKESKREYLVEEEIIKLVSTKCKNNEVKRAFIFGCFTGLRVSDLKRLEWGNIEGDRVEIRQKKTNEILYIPLAKTAFNILFDNPSNVKHMPNVKVFDLPTTANYNIVLKDWFEKAKIDKNASSHVARHSYATLNLTKGNDLFTVSKLLGNRSLKTTQIYAKIIDSKRREAVDRLPDITINDAS